MRESSKTRTFRRSGRVRRQRQRLPWRLTKAGICSSYRKYRSEIDNTYSSKQPGLYAWNSGNGTGFFPKKLREVKTGIPHKRKHHMIS